VKQKTIKTLSDSVQNTERLCETKNNKKHTVQPCENSAKHRVIK